MGPQTSIVIPSLDSPLIAATLDSVRRQSIESAVYEIIVVGRDRPNLVPRDGSVLFVETPTPVGPGEARNRGVAAAQGDFLLFTDADCRPSDSWIERMHSHLARYPVVGGAVRFPLSSNRWSVGDNIASFHELLEDRPSASNRGPVGSLNLGIRREAWERVGPFDRSLITSEDYDWYLRARSADLDVYFDSRAVVEHADARATRSDLEGHAAWYGSHFLDFCRKHPGVFGSGPTWKSRRTLALTRSIKSWMSALAIYGRHPMLWPAWRALPVVVAFKSAWYRAVLESWETG